MEPGVTSMQTVLLSPEMCMVVDDRMTFKVSKGKPTLWNGRKAANPKALILAIGNLPGSLDHGMYAKG